MKAIVLCGGLGTRLGELTRHTPKPMLTVAGRPFIAHVLDLLQHAPVDGILLAAGFAWESLRDYVGALWGSLPVTYSVESEPMGTGGALRLAMHRANLDRALILNGDTLFRMNLRDFITHSDEKAATCMALRSIPDCSRYGRVTLDASGRISTFGEKGHSGPGLINAGVYLQQRRALEAFGERPFSFETDYLSTHCGKDYFAGYVQDAYFIDIGIPVDLDRAQRELLPTT
jgi:D-glycero-alpha-D-manno-heptose 1-phosphate guanylyltransferase